MVLAFLVVLSGFLLTAQNVFAVSVNISNVPSTISDQPFNIDASVAGAQAGTNYIRANIFPTGTTDYFGYTYNGSSFVNSSNYYDYLPVTIDSSGNWSGTIQAKMDPSSSYFTGPGSYSLKVRRYTTLGSYTWSNEITVNVNYSNPTPTPTLSPAPTSSPSSGSSFTISNIPSQIDSTQTFSVSVSLNLPSNSGEKIYLKGAFKRADSSNYFGQTLVGSNWIRNSDSYSNQFSANLDTSGILSGSLQVSPDVLDSGYEGTDDYIFKVARYSKDGGGPTWSNEVNIKILAKEITSQEPVTDLSRLTPKTSGSVKGTSTSALPEIPEAVYSLENYRKLASTSATPRLMETASVKQPKENFPILPIGGSILGLGIILSILIFFKKRVKFFYEKIYHLLKQRNT